MNYIRFSESGAALSKRNQSVRTCIASALINLMTTLDIKDITITELTKKAHCSRMTFYKYYATKEEVLYDYMYEIIDSYRDEIKSRSDIGNLHDYTHICHCLNFFKEYRSFFLTLVNANLYSILIESLNKYMHDYVQSYSHKYPYELYYYLGALCTLYVQWIKYDCRDTPESIAHLIYSHLNTAYQHI